MTMESHAAVSNYLNHQRRCANSIKLDENFQLEKQQSHHSQITSDSSSFDHHHADHDMIHHNQEENKEDRVQKQGPHGVEIMYREVKLLLSFKKEQESKVLKQLNDLHFRNAKDEEEQDEQRYVAQDEDNRHEQNGENRYSSSSTTSNENKEKEFYSSKDRCEKAKKNKSSTQEELHRLMCVHKDLKNQAESLTNLNEATVQPVMEKDKLELGIMREEVSTARRELEKEATTVESLSRLYKEIYLKHDQEVVMLQEEKERLEIMITSQDFPDGAQETVLNGIDDLRKKVRNLEYELAAGNETLASLENEITKKNEARETLEQQKRDLVENCESERRKSTRLSGQCESLLRTLAVAQAKFQLVTTARVQIEIKQREVDDKIRQESASSATNMKQLNNLMSTYVKKKAVLDRSKKTVGELETKLKDQELWAKEQRHLYTEQSKSIENLKDIINIEVTRLLERTNLEVEIKTDLEELLAEGTEKEVEVETWILETKKFKKIETALGNQLNVRRQHLRSIKDDIKMLYESIKLKRMVLAETKKAIGSTNQRSHEFRALCESLEGEKNGISAAISASVLSENELQKQIEKCGLDLQVSRQAREEKQYVLAKERDCHDSDRTLRATSRVEITNIKAALSMMTEETGHQDKNIRNLKAILDSARRAAMNESMRNGLLYERNSVLSEQLNDKKSEIHTLLLRVNIQEETIKRGNLSLIQRKEDAHSLEIKCHAAERYIHLKKSIQYEIKQLREKIVDLKAQRSDELNQLTILSKCIEDPNNFEQNGRWKELGGEDLDNEQLDAKKLLLQQRLDENREQYLERDAILDDLLSQIALLQTEKDSIIVKGRPALKELEDCQAAARDTTRSLMALVSELSMYHATALQLEEERELKQDELSRSIESMRNGQPSSIPTTKALGLASQKRRNEEANFITGNEDQVPMDTLMQEYKNVNGYYPACNSSRTTAEPRPSAYIPDVGPQILKPFGNMAHPAQRNKFRKVHY